MNYMLIIIVQYLDRTIECVHLYVRVSVCVHVCVHVHIIWNSFSGKFES